MLKIRPRERPRPPILYPASCINLRGANSGCGVQKPCSREKPNKRCPNDTTIVTASPRLGIDLQRAFARDLGGSVPPKPYAVDSVDNHNCHETAPPETRCSLTRE